MASNETGHNGREETIQEVLRDPGSAVLFVGYPRWLLHFAAGCCILFMLIGIPGNLFTIVALFRTKKLKNATTIFIMNLSISDLMFCCFNLPLATSTFWHSSWQHGPFLCRLFPLLRYGLVAVSLFSILTITINRYIIISHPRLYPRIYKPKYLILMILGIWIAVFGILIITWFESWGRFGLDVAIGSCSILPDINGQSPKEFLFFVAFLIPCIVIVVCYARIFYIVRKTAFKSRKRHIHASIDPNEINQERPTSIRNQEEELSILSSNCTTNVLCPNFSSKCTKTSFNQLNYSRSPSRSAIEEWEQSSWIQTHVEKGEISGFEEEKVQQMMEAERWEKNSKEQVNQSNNDTSVKTMVEICDKSRPDLVIKIDDIPYVDDLEAMETVSSNDCTKIKESTEKNSTNSGNKIERTTSRASFLIESALWMQRLNSKTDSDRYDDDSKSNTPDRSTKKKPIIIRRESRFRSVRKFRNPDGPPRMSNKDKKLLKMILVIFSSFLICYLPITVTKIFKDSIDWRGLNIAGYILIYLTTCINPVVYVVMSSEYRSAYKNVLLCKNEFGANRATKK